MCGVKLKDRLPSKELRERLWPFGVCSKGVGSNSMQCSGCQKWVHKKCSGIKGIMSKVAKSFICRGCLNLVTSAVRTSMDIGASAKLELVDKFCYLGDMLSVDGDADAAVEARIRIGWNKFRQLVPLKGKIFPYSLPSVGPGADPGVQAVSPQVTSSESRHIPSSSMPLLSARPAFTFVALTRRRYL